MVRFISRMDVRYNVLGNTIRYWEKVEPTKYLLRVLSVPSIFVAVRRLESLCFFHPVTDQNV